LSQNDVRCQKATSARFRRLAAIGTPCRAIFDARALTRAALQDSAMINPISKDVHLAPVERAAQNPLILGLFLPLQSGAWSPSMAPRST